MQTREVLIKMREWIETEIEKAKKPLADPFVLTSLAYCAEKAVGSAEVQETLLLLRSVATTERQHGTYDVATPYGALFLINRALATQS
ncbi:MAG: hypothetical protein Q7R71_01340 [bacterium]|nr:hypothetical protein [bacterium]